MSKTVTASDMFLLKEYLWPDDKFYDKQVETVESVCRDRETYVVAGNQLGKDYIAGFICPAAFLVCQAKGITCRIITLSVADYHLDVLWGEIGQRLARARKPLNSTQGGPLVVNVHNIYRIEDQHQKNPYNYLRGMVYENPDKLAGHHAEWTLFVADEASGIDDVAYNRAQGWAKHMLIFGNPNPCQNFFYKGVKAGDLVVS